MVTARKIHIRIAFFQIGLLDPVCGPNFCHRSQSERHMCLDPRISKGKQQSEVLVSVCNCLKASSKRKKDQQPTYVFPNPHEHGEWTKVDAARANGILIFEIRGPPPPPPNHELFVQMFKLTCWSNVLWIYIYIYIYIYILYTSTSWYRVFRAPMKF